jgi:hypothetical protein
VDYSIYIKRENKKLIKYIFLLMLVVFGNCSTVANKDQYSMVGEDYVCEEDDPKDCKYPFESY